MLEGINYWDAVTESPSQLEICFAIFANVLELDDRGDPEPYNAQPETGLLTECRCGALRDTRRRQQPPRPG